MFLVDVCDNELEMSFTILVDDFDELQQIITRTKMQESLELVSVERRDVLKGLKELEEVLDTGGGNGRRF